MPTILLNIYEDAEQDDRLEFALALARSQNAHISCVHAQLVNVPMPMDIGGGGADAALMLDIQCDAAANRARIEAKLAGEGVAWDWQEAEGGVTSCLVRAAQLVDAIVVSQDLVGRDSRQPVLNILNDLVDRTPVAVFMVPVGYDRFVPSDPALVAWNGSDQAAAALRHALPFLQKAASVHLVEIEEKKTPFPSLEAVQYLARHGVTAEIHRREASEQNVADEIIRAALYLRAAYVVMGAYSHSPLREMLLGGVTCSMLRQTSIPLLLTR